MGNDISIEVEEDSYDFDEAKARFVMALDEKSVIVNRNTAPQADNLSFSGAWVITFVVVFGGMGGIFWLIGESSLTFLLVIWGVGAMFALGMALLGIGWEQDWRLYNRTAQVEAVGTVVVKAREEGSSDYGDYCLYHVTVRFSAGPNEILLRATVGEELYESTSEGASLTVRYAPSYPTAAMLEGEY